MRQTKKIVNKTGRNQKGFTMVELMFVCLLLPMVASAIYGVTRGAQQIFKVTDVYSTQNEAAMQALRTITRELGETNTLTTAGHLTISSDGLDNSSVVTFQIPVDWDNDGDVVTDTARPVVEWGAYEDVGQTTDGIEDGYIRYQLIESGNELQGYQLVREVLDASETYMEGTRKILASNISGFEVEQDDDDSNLIHMTVTAQRAEDSTGRILNAEFTHTVMVRNSTT